MFRFDAPIDWHVGEVWKVKKPGPLPGAGYRCVNGYVQVRFLSDGKEQNIELLPGDYGVQQKWVLLRPLAGALVS